MDIDEFMRQNNPACGEEKHRNYWEEVVQALGGAEEFAPYMPTDMATLRKSYAQNEHFNTDLTPLRVWDRACGVYIPCEHPGYLGQPTVSGGVVRILQSHGIKYVSVAEAVCLLKTAAAMLVQMEENHHA